jgi:hypothetical protein
MKAQSGSVLCFLTVLFFAGSIQSQVVKKPDPVTVANTAAQPVPVQQVGPVQVTGDIKVTNIPTVQIGNIPSVNIANTPVVKLDTPPVLDIAAPLNTKSLDEPGRTPYLVQQAFSLTCQRPILFHLNLRNQQCNATFPPVPSGKRLVIQHVSGELIVDSDLGAAPYLVSGLIQGQTAQVSHLLTVSFLTQDTNAQGLFFHDIYRIDEATQMFIEPGDAPQINAIYGIDRAHSALLAGSVTLSGYLVDVP